MHKKTLRGIRRVIGAVFFAGITLMFLDFTGTLHRFLGWMARIQLLPAVLALNFAVVAVLLALTFLFGRIYCSVVCPLGVFQDGVAHVHGLFKKNRYTYSKAHNILRYAVLGLFIVAMAAGAGSAAALLAPYSAYGRIVQNLFAPVYQWCNNGLAHLSERFNSYTFYSKEVWIRSLPTFLIAAVTFATVVVLAWRNGRTYCNNICPVGTFLGFFSRFSWLKMHIDEEKCVKCGLCNKNCKASCIDGKNGIVDHSRCVTCGNCMAVCPKGAIEYRHVATGTAPVENGAVDTGRRAFLVGSAVALGTAALAQEKKKVDGGLAELEDKKAPRRDTPVVPPGALSLKNMQTRCTGCQLCVSECPNGVLRPSTDLMHLMQPVMSFERGYCRPECTRCSDVCPAGAIKPLDEVEKSAVQIGHAVVITKNCISALGEAECGNCARHCPTQAIEMVPSDPDDDLSPAIPAVNEETCIGCGACEHLCPARPFSAIYVEGHEVHRYI